MQSPPPDDLDARIRAHHARGQTFAQAGQAEPARSEFSEATALIIRGYGPELQRWFVHKVGNAARAADLYQELGVWLWRGLPGFRWEAALRTWLYTLAYHVLCHDARKRAAERAGPDPADPDGAQLSAVGVDMTSLGSRRDKRAALLACLAELTEADRHLVLLRQLEGDNDNWKDLAHAWHGYRPMPPEALDAEAARLRQRFHRAMETLRAHARDRGLDV